VRDPHVERLHYRLVPEAGVEFSDALPPIEAHTARLSARLSKGALVVELLEHHASGEAAREAVGPYLRAWEIRHALWAGGPEFRFDFDHADVVDRDPPPPPKPGEARTVYGEITSTVHLSGSVSAHVARGSYPSPPSDFAIDVDVETLWHRWTGYLAGQEPLQSMAYFCLTVLEIHGGRGGAAARFNISGRLLSTLGRLATEAGDKSTARKAAATYRPLTGPERGWLEAAVKKLITRVGEFAANPAAPLQKLTMADLPQI
jgi:hypothetical protein